MDVEKQVWKAYKGYQTYKRKYSILGNLKKKHNKIMWLGKNCLKKISANALYNIFCLSDQTGCDIIVY